MTAEIKSKVQSIRSKLADQSKYVRELEASVEKLREDRDNALRKLWQTERKLMSVDFSRNEAINKAMHEGARLALLALGQDATPERVSKLINEGTKLSVDNSNK